MSPFPTAAQGRHSPVDTVLFDLGKVLVEWDPCRPYEGRHDRAAVEAFFTAIDFPAFNHEQDAGRSWAQAREELARTHPEHLAMLDVYTEHFAEAIPGPVDGAPELVADLLAAGLRVLGLTNWAAETFPVAEQKAPFLRHLEDVLVSGRVGVAKPDPAVFRLAAERFGLDPARTVFTDDSAVNVRSATACGYRGELFTDHGTLRARLRSLGVPLPPAPVPVGGVSAT